MGEEVETVGLGSLRELEPSGSRKGRGTSTSLATAATLAAFACRVIYLNYGQSLAGREIHCRASLFDADKLDVVETVAAGNVRGYIDTDLLSA